MKFPSTLLIAGSCLLFAACGVSYGKAKQGNEFFKSLTVTGDHQATVSLTALVTYETNYPKELGITCELRQGKELIKPIGHDTAPALPGAGAKATPFPGSFSYDFIVDTPGAYKAECFTPADEDNFIIKEFTVAGPPAVQPTPLPIGGPIVQ